MRTIKIFLFGLVVALISFPTLTTAQTLSSYKSCPKGSTSIGCVSGKLIAGADLVLEFSGGVPTDATGIVLNPSPTVPDNARALSASQKNGFLVASIPANLSAGTWEVYYRNSGGHDVLMQKEASTGLPLELEDAQAGTGTPGQGGGTGTGSQTSGGKTPQSVGDGGGSVRAGLDAIKGEFSTTGDIAGASSIGKLIVGVIKFLLGILFALAVLMIVIGGFLFVTSAGNEERAKSGRKTVMYAIIGLVIVILSYVLVDVVQKAVTTGNPNSP